MLRLVTDAKQGRSYDLRVHGPGVCRVRTTSILPAMMTALLMLALSASAAAAAPGRSRSWWWPSTATSASPRVERRAPCDRELSLPPVDHPFRSRRSRRVRQGATTVSIASDTRAELPGDGQRGWPHRAREPPQRKRRLRGRQAPGPQAAYRDPVSRRGHQGHAFNVSARTRAPCRCSRAALRSGRPTTATSCS